MHVTFNGTDPEVWMMEPHMLVSVSGFRDSGLGPEYIM